MKKYLTLTASLFATLSLAGMSNATLAQGAAPKCGRNLRPILPGLHCAPSTTCR
jgi:hypothetical protein